MSNALLRRRSFILPTNRLRTSRMSGLGPDHDLDAADEAQIDVFADRGVLIERPGPLMTTTKMAVEAKLT
jgi:hypothetical protein